MTIGPRQIVELDLTALRQAAASRTDLDSVYAQILSSAAPGSLIGAAYSEQNATGTIYDVPLRDSGKNRNGTGSYPWRVDNDYSTNVVLTNVGNIPAKFQVELRYPGGPYSIKQRELAVGESASFDLRAIRDEQQPDRTGKTLPETINGGQFHWSIVQTPGDARIVGRAEVVSRSQRVVSSYSCPVCCQDNGPSAYFNPNAYQLYADGFAVVGADGTYWDCYYNYYTGSASFNSLSTLNTSVATANSGTSELEGIAVGDTDVVGEYEYVYWEDDGMNCYQRFDSASNNAPVGVRNGPDHVQIISDKTETWCLGGATSLKRIITYQVVDQYNNPITNQLSIGERFFAMNDHTCGAGAPDPSNCHVYLNGQFTDTLFAGCTPIGGTCGYDVLNQLVYCQSLGVPKPIASLDEVVHANQITVNGNSTSFAPGYSIYP